MLSTSKSEFSLVISCSFEKKSIFWLRQERGSFRLCNLYGTKLQTFVEDDCMTEPWKSYTRSETDKSDIQN